MRSNTATDFENQTPGEDRRQDSQQLQDALGNWREHILRFLQEKSVEASDRVRSAEDGLAITFRNPGEVADDVVAILWDQLEKNSVRLWRIAHVSDAVQDMDFPALVTLFSLTAKVQTYPWEGDRWRLPSSMF